MQWLELTIKTRSAGIDRLAEELTVRGFDSFTIDDEADFHEFLEHNKDYWDYVDEELQEKMQGVSQIRLYLENNDSATETVQFLKEELRQIRTRFGEDIMGGLSLNIQGMQDEDWENNWKQYYKPLAIGEKLLVVPQWLTAENPEGRIPVILDPGMIFGTGAHGTTQMCMRALEKVVRGGEEIIDLGSGSGILSITALLLGAKHATGVDIDPKAEDIARENAAMNDLYGDRFTAVTGDVIGDEGMMRRLAGDGYDIVLANIVADVIIPLSKVVPHFLKENGIFICSGILESRLDEVKSAIVKAGLTIVETVKQEDWCRITAVP
ncbi:MAG: 50S ribosomal protein L11 methyltransferase [Oscillospiraceae bacterium]|nr:50S ribosomal protein L11 methyltransferase [Oscillospiraceae bacterium]